MTITLKEMTKRAHTEAEKSAFMKKLLKGQISKNEYAQFLYNNLFAYSALEELIPEFFEGNDLSRSRKIVSDLFELQENNLKITPSTKEYVAYLATLNKEQLKSHIYVRYMGDLFGGQFIKNSIPTTGNMLKFNDVESLKQLIRSCVNESHAEEANKCFDFIRKINDELLEMSAV